MNQAELAQWKTNPITKEILTGFKRRMEELKAESLETFDFDNPYRVHAQTAHRIGEIQAYYNILNLEPTEEDDE